MKRVVLISASSFFGAGPRVGMQFIAQILARAGFETHYISQPSSPLDLLSAARRSRFRRAWSGRDPYTLVENNLWEHFVRTPFPANKKFWLLARQYDWYGKLLPRPLRRLPFDLCIHDVSSCYPLVERLCVQKMILRVNDRPEGFSYVVPKIVIKKLLKRIAVGRYEQTWSASTPLLEYTRSINPQGTHVLISNGVDCERFVEAPASNPDHKRTAVFVGALARWVDLPLLDAAAALLPDWRIDLYGPHMTGGKLSSPNIHFRGPADYQDLPGLLAKYRVGLIPFVGNDPLIAMMERPLKFFEYLAAGLGIAATDAGGLKDGMHGWARFGSTPEEYACAIRLAAGDTGRDMPQRRAYLERFSWPRIGRLVLDHVERALAA